MQVSYMCLLAVVAVSQAQLSWEDLAVHDDECLSSTDPPSACTLSALQFRAKRKQSEESSCMPVNQWCGNNYAEKTCCNSEDRCIPDGNIWKCKSGGSHGDHDGHSGWCKP